jgi:tankyrase
VDANAASRSGIRPIHLALAEAGVNALTRHGARLDVADHRGFGPLHWALSPDVATALVKAGADPNKLHRGAANVPAAPPLFLAINKLNRPLGERLLELGADANGRDTQGRTALFASVQANGGLLDLLLARGADLTLAVEVNALSKTQLRIAGAAGFVDPQDDMTALHWATLLDNRDLLKTLAARVADVNIKSRLGLTPLHWAAGANKYPAVVTLLGCGADPSVKNNAGQTPLDLATARADGWLVAAALRVADLVRNVKPRASAPAEGKR